MGDDKSKRIAQLTDALRAEPGSRVTLPRDFDPAFKAGLEGKQDGAGLLEEGLAMLSEYQERLAAQDTYGVVVVLQGIDAAGKDGIIRHVMSGLNPQGVRVESFKVPSEPELKQDFLRRYQERLPSRGQIGLFNRSHYEEVLVVRVHPENLVRQKLPTEARGQHVWRSRYEAINDWERYLVANGFRIVKLFLNLSKEEQRCPLPPTHRSRRAQLEVLRERPGGAGFLERLSGRVLGDAHPYEHRAGAVVRDPGRPQMVRPYRCCRGHRSNADRDRPPVPDARRGGVARA